MHISLRRSALSVAALAVLATPAFAQSAKEFYSGKTLNFVVGSSPGGGYDTYTRTLARHFTNHMPGKPTIIVRNMPGAGSLTSVMHLDTTGAKDGTVMTAFNSGLFNDSIADGDKAKVKFTNFAFVGSITRDFRVCFTWKATGIAKFEDLSTRKETIFGATGPNSNSYNGAAMLKNVFDLPMKIITAYPGNSELFLAIERGELDGECVSWTSIPEAWIKEKKINVLAKLGAGTGPADFPAGVPSISDKAKTEEQKDVIEVLLAPGELGRPYIMSKDVPADRLAFMRDAFMATMKDAAFVADAKKQGLEVDPVGGAEAQKLVAKLYTFPPATVAKAKEALK